MTASNEVQRQKAARARIIELCDRADIMFEKMVGDASMLGTNPATLAISIRGAVRHLREKVRSVKMTPTACARRNQDLAAAVRHAEARNFATDHVRHASGQERT